jgi:hypothetical protein
LDLNFNGPKRQRVWPLMNGVTADSPLWMRDLAQETVYVVQSFRAGRGTRLLADPPLACKSELTARRTAERLALSKVGVVAWSRAGDAELGDFDEEPVVFFRAGRMPAELDE